MNNNQSNTNQPNSIPEEIIEQIIIVRDTGRTNMFDLASVQRIAYELDLFELVEFLEERNNHKTYVDFILHGGKKQDK